MEKLYTPPPQFSGGYFKNMECIEVMALEAVDNGFLWRWKPRLQIGQNNHGQGNMWYNSLGKTLKTSKI